MREERPQSALLGYRSSVFKHESDMTWDKVRINSRIAIGLKVSSELATELSSLFPPPSANLCS